MTKPTKPGPSNNWDPPPTPNPYVYSTLDFGGRTATMSVGWLNGVGTILSITTSREEACTYRTFIIGVGPDGTPDTSNAKIPIPAGSNLVSALLLGVLQGLGIGTINDLLAQQICATETEY